MGSLAELPARASRAALALLVTFVLLFGQALVTAVPAQAVDLLACLNTFTGYRTGIDIVSEVADPEFAYCAGRVASDPAMAAVAAVVVGAGQAGAFKDEATCKNMLTGQLGKLIAYLLVQAGIADMLAKIPGVGPDFSQQLVNFAKDQAVSNIASIPALQPMMSYLDCGCVIAGKADAAQQITKAYYDDVKACAGGVFALGKAAVEGFISGVKSIVEAGLELLGLGKSKPPPHYVVTSYGHCDNWITVRTDGYIQQPTLTGWEAGGYTSKSPQPITVDTGTVMGEIVTAYRTDAYICSCPLPGAIETRKISDTAMEFRCGCPAEGRAFDSNSRTCLCNANEWRENGVCTSCSAMLQSEDSTGTTAVSGKMTGGTCVRQQLTCAPGQTPFRNYDNTLACRSTCPAGTFNSYTPGQLPSQGQCVTCPSHSVPVAGTGMGEVGPPQCQQCPRGTAASPGDLSCRTLVCPGGISPDNPNACRQACRLVGDGAQQHLVCDGPAIMPPVVTQCPDGAVAIGGRCIGPYETEPDLAPIQRGLEELVIRPPVRMDPIIGGPAPTRPPTVTVPARPPATGNTTAPPRATPVQPQGGNTGDRRPGGNTPVSPPVVISPEQLIDLGRMFEFTLPGTGSGTTMSPEGQGGPRGTILAPSTDYTSRDRRGIETIISPEMPVERVYE